MMNKVKKTLPEYIQKKMAMWRDGMIPMPIEYIKFHEDLAHEELDFLEDTGLVVDKVYMNDDGWFDGMKTLVVIGKWEESNNSVRLQWNDGNQEFFVKLKSGGSIPLRLVPSSKFELEV